jgi:hypothetical protein
MCSTTLKTLEELFQKGNRQKLSRISADRARAVIVEGLAEFEWYERAVVTEAKIKAYFGTTLTSRKKLLADAEATERIAAADAAADGEATNGGDMAASESETIHNIGTVNEAFDVMCRTVEMTAIKELENLHTEDLHLYEEENL